MTNANSKFLVKVFSPRVLSQAVTALDKSTGLVVSACWLAALVMMILAVLAVHAAVSAKKDAVAAMAAEPLVPKEAHSDIPPRDLQIITERLQHQFVDIKVDLSATGTITFRTQDGSKFHQWITALSYIDTMAPQYRWTLKGLCVGSCSNQDLMKAEISGQKMTFTVAQ